MKQPVRFLLIGAAVFAILLTAAIGVAFSSTFQTWATRKALAARPELHATVQNVSAGLRHVELQNLRFVQGGAILSIPTFSADLPVPSAALSKQIFVSRLSAKGWTLDLSKTAEAAATGRTAGGSPATGSTAGPGAKTPAANPVAGNPPPVPPHAVAQAFAGLFSKLQLPVDVSIDGVDLEGDVILPGGAGRAKVHLTGGGLGEKREGQFALNGEAALSTPDVSTIELKGVLTAAMDTRRTFTRISTKLDAAAKGRKFPNGVQLSADLAVARNGETESYVAGLATSERQLLTVNATFPPKARQLDGTWKLDLSDSDLAPFALGRSLPAFAAKGEGKFDADATFTAIHASGQLNATADRLDLAHSALSAIGAVQIAAEFDLANHGSTLTLDKLDADVATADRSGAMPATRHVAHVKAIQPFEFNFGTAEVKVADASRDLIGVTLDGLPLIWAKPFLKGIALSGSDVTGELVTTPRAGGISLRTKAPLVVKGLSVTQAGRPLAHNVDVTLAATGDYTSHAWQAEVSNLTFSAGSTTIAQATLKAGKLAGAQEPIKATGRLALDIPGVMGQPLAAGALNVAAGQATVDFVTSVTPAKQEVQADIAVQNLAARSQPDQPVQTLPAISGKLRADILATGQVALNAPLVLERDGRKSDVALSGTIVASKSGHAIEAQLTSGNLVIDDAKMLSALLPPRSPAHPAAVPPQDKAPPWAGLTGAVALQLKKVIYSDTFQATDVTGTLRIEGGTLTLEKFRAGMGEGVAKVDGVVVFSANQTQPYALFADVSLQQVDPAPLFKAVNPQQPPTIEGKFDITSKLNGRASTLGGLASGAGGEFQFTSKGGTFRGLPVSVASVTEKSGKIAEYLSSMGSMLGGLTGKKDAPEAASKAEAVTEVAKGLNPIPYDQLNVTITRDTSLNAQLKNFTLISPDFRLSGSGQTTHQPGKPLLDDALAMNFSLRARSEGRYAALLRYLGALEPQKDDLGYAACTVPLNVGGTLGKPDAGETSFRFAQLALEKAGVMEKAGELYNKIMRK